MILLNNVALQVNHIYGFIYLYQVSSCIPCIHYMLYAVRPRTRQQQRNQQVADLPTSFELCLFNDDIARCETRNLVDGTFWYCLSQHNADGLAPNGTRASAIIFMTQVGRCISGMLRRHGYHPQMPAFISGLLPTSVTETVHACM